jgi:hypothetical protein
MLELWPSDWILHNDNAPAHKALSVKMFQAEKSITEMEHPLCSPDLAPNGFWLFPKIKSSLKDKYTGILALKAVPQQESQTCFQQWQHRWAKFTAAEGEYIEGDPLSIYGYAYNKIIPGTS